ncbi:MAG: riboflavin synthase [Patescibacteria group bacterium]
MFTGIVERQGRIRAVSGIKNKRFTVEKPVSWKLKTGASVAVDGICVTVTSHTKNSFSCDLMPETLSRTTARQFRVGATVNLERPLKLGDELGGHIVLGHVDVRGKIMRVYKRGTAREATVSVPARFMRLVAEKGSIVLNGVSLTVSKKQRNTFAVALIPHTLKATNLGSLQKGDGVNVEFDATMRYLAARKKK